MFKKEEDSTRASGSAGISPPSEAKLKLNLSEVNEVS